MFQRSETLANSDWISGAAKLEHPSSVAFGDTFSHKGRRKSLAYSGTFRTAPLSALVAKAA